MRSSNGVQRIISPGLLTLHSSQGASIILYVFFRNALRVVLALGCRGRLWKGERKRAVCCGVIIRANMEMGLCVSPSCGTCVS